MEKSTEILSDYIRELSFINSTLQKEEYNILEIDKKIKNKANTLHKTNDELEEYNYDLDMRLLAVIEQSDFLDILSPELERAKIKREHLMKKQQEYDQDNGLYNQREMKINHQFINFPENKKRLFSNVNKKLLESNNSYLTYDNELNTKDNHLIAEREIIEIINKNCRSILPPKIINTILPIRTRKREGSMSKKKSMSTNTSLSNIGVTDSLLVSPVKTTDGVVNPNKSFYLLWNARIQQSITNLTEITKEDIGGHNCCKRLLKAYYHNIHFTNKLRSKSVTYTQHIRSITQKSHRENMRKLTSSNFNIPNTIRQKD